MNEEEFVKRGPSWWNRDRESFCWSGGRWLYYSNSIVSGIPTAFEKLPVEIQAGEKARKGG